MKTQRTPDAQAAEYCLIPLTHKASPYQPRAEADVRKTWQSYGWSPTIPGAKHDNRKQ